MAIVWGWGAVVEGDDGYITPTPRPPRSRSLLAEVAGLLPPFLEVGVFV